MSEGQLRLEIRADADQATQEINRLEGQLNDLNRTTAGSAMGEQFQRVGGQMTAVGHNIVNTMQQVGVAIVGVASEYETALASYSRISGVVGKELDDLGQEFINLSKEIPRTIPELVTIGEEAAKIGVGKEGVIEFTKLISQMSVAFDLSAEETGEAVGKLSANFGMLENGIPDMKRLETLGNVINNLGDSLAAGEGGIIEFVKRTAGLYKTAGITETELAAFGATMQDVGIVPETSARAFEKFASILAKGKNNTENASEGFDLLGLSAQKMQQMMISGQGTEAMFELFDAIKKAGPEAQIATEAMFGEFGGEALRVANSANGVRKSFELMTKSMAGEGATLESGLNTMSATFASQMTLLQNSFAGLGIAIAGTGLLEDITNLVKMFSNFVTKVSEVNPFLLKSAVAVGVLVAGVGLLLIPLGSLVSILGTIMTLSSAGVFAGLAATVAGWGAGFMAAATGALAFLTPLLPIVGVIVAIGVALIPVIMFIQQFVAVVQEFGVVNGIFMAVTAVVQAFGQIVVGVFAGAIAAVVGFVGGLGLAIGAGVAAIVGGGLKIIAAIATWIESILGVPPVFSSALNNAASIVLGFVGVFRNAGARLMSALGDGVRSAVSGVTSSIASAMSAIRSYLPFSDAKVGPLSDLTYSGASIPRTMAEGIKGNAQVLEETMVSLLNFPSIKQGESVYTINPQSITNINNQYTVNPVIPDMAKFEAMPSPVIPNNSVTNSTNSTVSTNNNPVNVTINLNGNDKPMNLIKQLREEGNAIAKIVEDAMAKRDRTKYARA
jgi:TP901 family phage tail tape measure protein